jgi:outer membrane immunogenic protein
MIVAGLRWHQSEGSVMRSLRWLLCGFAFAALVQEGRAADLGETFLRGSQTVMSAPSGARWDGFYFGAQVGVAYTGTDFGNSTRQLTSFLLRNTTIEDEAHVSNWTTLGKYDATGSSYGGFAGYQRQWDNAVVGFEANYNRTNLSAAAADSMRRIFSTSDGYSNNVSITASSSIHITDYGTLRVKGGWAIDCFMPYGFAGVAIGRADVTRAVHVVGSGFDLTTQGRPNYAFDQSNAETKNGAFAYGYTAGFGLDVMVMQNMFVRGEYEYVQFGEFNDLKTHIHTARVAAALKF